MKLRYIITAIASAAIFAGCQTEPMVGSFADFEVSKTFVSIPLEGGSTEVSVKSVEDWEFTKHYDTGKKDDQKNPIMDYAPAWITLSSTTGAAGESTLTITAAATPSGREVELQLKSGSKLQHIIVRQGSVEPEEASVQDVLEGPDGKSYIVKGTVTSIVNTTYGNWYLKDDSTDDLLYIYGTLDKDGKTKNFLSLGLEVGDVVKVSGPKTTYNSTVELVDVTVLSIEKALLGISEVTGDVDEGVVPNLGGELNFVITYKGKGVFANPTVDWITMSSSSFKAGIPTLFEKNPADTAYYSFKVAPNMGYNDREGSIEFSSSALNEKNETISTNTPYTISQGPLELDGHLYELATEIEDGATYVLVTPSGNMMTNISGNYGNPAAADAIVYLDWVITLATSYNYTFEAVDGGYKIKQDDNRYIYQTGTYTNFNAGNEIPENGAGVFSAELQDDGTFTITCVDKGNKLGYNQAKNNFECSQAEGLESVLLYKYVRSEGSVLKTYSYKKATALDFVGKKILLVAKQGDVYYAAVPIPSDKTYGYANGFDVTEALSEDVITLKSQDYEWSIAEAGTGKYKIVLPDGRYIYQSGTYNSFQVAEADADDATVANTFAPGGDGAWTITSATGWIMRQGDGTYNSFGFYAADYSGNATLPFIYVLQDEE